MAAWQLAAVDFVLKGGKWAGVQMRSVSMGGGGGTGGESKTQLKSDFRVGQKL